MRLQDIVETSHIVAATSRRLEKIEHLAAALRRLGPEEIEVGLALLAGELRQGRIGIGGSQIEQAASVTPAAASSLTLTEVDDVFSCIARTSGPGSAAERQRLLAQLFSRATERERDFLIRVVLRELRQGALEGLIVEALARAADVPVREVRRAAMLAGDLGRVARAALTQGSDGLAPFTVRLFQPLRSMLAESAEDVPAALARLQRAAFEIKLDGARVQVHKGGDEVRIFSRRMNDVTRAAPEIVEVVQRLPAREVVLDGEAVVLGAGGAPVPFQVTMRRFGRKLEVERMREALPLSPFFFDCLYVEGRDLLALPAEERFRTLTELLPDDILIQRLVTADVAEAQAFLERTLELGHEGLMAKSLDAPYEAGVRSQGWLKIKPAHTLDLVVLAAEWGHGRRHGWLSNLHLGARDPESGEFVMLGKTFKGLTDEVLEWQTGRLLQLEVRRDAATVHVRPELVVEIAFNDIQTSPHYPGGMALRFARVKRYRDDKTPAEADTIDTVRALHEKAWRQ